MKKKTLSIFSIIFLIVLGSILTPPSGYSFLTPNLAITGMIFWVIKKKCPLNNYDIFLLGLLNDLLIGTPLGSSSLCYFLVKESIFILDTRLKKNNVLINLVKFIFGLTSYFFFVYIFLIIYFTNYPSINYFLMSYFLTLFIYPIIYISLNWIENKMSHNEL